MQFTYLNRDISWLYFNHRVLEEAKDTSLPLYERLKFLAIYSNNLEEFYRVRVSYYRKLLRELPEDDKKFKTVQPAATISAINSLVSKFQDEFMDIFQNTVIKELRANNIHILEQNSNFTVKQTRFIEDIFNANILPFLQPVLLIKKRVKPFLRTGQIYIVLEMSKKTIRPFSVSTSRGQVYGLVKLPTDHGISRFIQLPKDAQGNHCVMFLEDIMMMHIQAIYPGYNIDSWYSIKMTRDADLDYEEHESDELIDIISNIATTRQLGLPNRFQHDYSMPVKLLDYIAETFDLEQEDLVKAGRYHNFRDFFGFPNPISPLLELERHHPLLHPTLHTTQSLIRFFEKHEIMLHFPYQSYAYFIKYLTEAAYDETVTEIKATQYRVANDSAVVKALILAARNGKKVTVFVELKARFDEENNLRFAQEMKHAGITIMYSMPRLKVHAKVALICRTSSKGHKKLSAFLATGNFNEKTAEVYCDHGFFTGDDKLTSELQGLFDILERKITNFSFSHILVPGFNMVERFEELIEQEIHHANNKEKAYMILKMNALEDPYMIKLLYKASTAGVKIDIIVRGACCLMPLQEYSKNIRLIRIVDRFLEHARVFYFFSGGKEHIYLSSADWMRRNLYRRIECAFPIYDTDIKKELLDILYIQLRDNVKASYITEDMKNERVPLIGKEVQAQKDIYEYLSQKYQ